MSGRDDYYLMLRYHVFFFCVFATFVCVVRRAARRGSLIYSSISIILVSSADATDAVRSKNRGEGGVVELTFHLCYGGAQQSGGKV